MSNSTVIQVTEEYLIKCLATGVIDTETQYPVSKSQAEHTTLVKGYVWSIIKVVREEMGVLSND